MRLYHFSEDQGIERFAPRAPVARPEVEPLVWAIDEWHQPLYYLPRDCPRVCFWPLPTTTPEDSARLFAQVAGRMVIAIEAAWLPRVQTTRLYRYTFSDTAFTSLHDAGMYVSRETVTPVRVEPVGDLLARLVGAGVELRLCQNLHPLGQAVSQSTLHYSLIRMRNARDWP